MMQQQFVPIKTFSLSASIAIVLFCHPAFALKKATSPTTAQGQDSANITLAQKQDDRANSSEVCGKLGNRVSERARRNDDTFA